MLHRRGPLTIFVLLLASALGADESDRLPFESKLVAGDVASGAKFGISVGLDKRWAIVGAQDDAYGSDPTGAAYLFRRGIDGSWHQVAKLVSGIADDAFGLSVALSEGTAVVGAWGDDGERYNAGSVHVFRRNAGGFGRWGRVARLTASDSALGDSFGFSVAIEGGRIVVGALLGDSSDLHTGAVYVFEAAGPFRRHWRQAAKLSPGDAKRGARFGSAVALSGNTILVGAPWTDAPDFHTGAAYVFEKEGVSGWREVARLTASDASAADNLGGSVALEEGIAVAGANGHDGAGNFSGAAYVFARDASGSRAWGEIAKLTAPDAERNKNFGAAVSIHRSIVVVGARGDDHAGFQSGAAYVFRRGASHVFRSVSKLTSRDADGFDHFARSVAVHRDAILVGSPGDDVVPFDSGSAFVFASRVPLCGVEAEHAEDALGLDFLLGTSRPVTWSVFSSRSGRSELLWTIPVGVIDPPIRFPVLVPDFSPPGPIGFATLLTGTEGEFVCAGVELVERGFGS